MATTVLETVDVAHATAFELDRQGEQLKRTLEIARRIDDTCNQADRHLSSMESIGMSIVNFFRSKPAATKQPDDQDFKVEWLRRGNKWHTKILRVSSTGFSRIGSKGVERARFLYGKINGILVGEYKNVCEISHGKKGLETIRCRYLTEMLSALQKRAQPRQLRIQTWAGQLQRFQTPDEKEQRLERDAIFAQSGDGSQMVLCVLSLTPVNINLTRFV
eukprot:TRINITY_DN2137_c0_g1_i1.p1 TRINITY_DN2137_c0_g1~~TRINITY_DN2137_c0_g1_i1.p1  ORF type:complete len:250 (-),score=28.59 TRINITY_DN2137_c0_g1_i1:810-1463(-)